MPTAKGSTTRRGRPRTSRRSAARKRAAGQSPQLFSIQLSIQRAGGEQPTAERSGSAAFRGALLLPRWLRHVRIVTVLLLFLLLAQCGGRVHQPAVPSIPCHEEARVFLTRLDTILERWERLRVTALALSDSPEHLAQALDEMRRLWREVEALDAPQCAEEVRRTALASMQQTIRVFELVLSGRLDQPDDQILALGQLQDVQLDGARSRLLSGVDLTTQR